MKNKNFGNLGKMDKKIGSIEKIDYQSLALGKSSNSKEETIVTCSVIITEKMKKLETYNPNDFWPSYMTVKGNKKHRTISFSSLNREEADNWFGKFGCLVEEEND